MQSAMITDIEKAKEKTTYRDGTKKEKAEQRVRERKKRDGFFSREREKKKRKETDESGRRVSHQHGISFYYTTRY